MCGASIALFESDSVCCCRWKSEAETALADVEKSATHLQATERKLALSLAESANLEDDIVELEGRLSEMEDEMRAVDEAAKDASATREEARKEEKELKSHLVTLTERNQALEASLQAAKDALGELEPAMARLVTQCAAREEERVARGDEVTRLTQELMQRAAHTAALQVRLNELVETVSEGENRVSATEEGSKASISSFKGSSLVNLLAWRRRDHPKMAWGWSKFLTAWKNHSIQQALGGRQRGGVQGLKGVPGLEGLEQRRTAWLKESMNRLCEALGVKTHDNDTPAQRSTRSDGNLSVSSLHPSPGLAMVPLQTASGLSRGSEDYSCTLQGEPLGSLQRSFGIFPRGRRNSKDVSKKTVLEATPRAVVATPKLVPESTGIGKVIVEAMHLDEWAVLERRVELAIAEAQQAKTASEGETALHYELAALQAAADSWEEKAIRLGAQLAQLQQQQNESSRLDIKEDSKMPTEAGLIGASILEDEHRDLVLRHVGSGLRPEDLLPIQIETPVVNSIEQRAVPQYTPDTIENIERGQLTHTPPSRSTRGVSGVKESYRVTPHRVRSVAGHTPGTETTDDPFMDSIEDPFLDTVQGEDDVVGVLRQGKTVSAVLYANDPNLPAATGGDRVSSTVTPFADREGDDVSHLRDDVAAMQARLNSVFF